MKIKKLADFNALNNVPLIGRMPLFNHINSALSATGQATSEPLNPLNTFEPSALKRWITTYLRYVFSRHHEFLSHLDAPNRTSIYTVPNELRVSVAGDWGTGTLEAELVARQMMAWEDGGATDLTIHLGDVYYVGDEREVRENCLGGHGIDNPQAEVTWPAGRLGSFALNGNHEMYANGTAYFDVFLPTLGWRDAAGNLPGQGPSFFCLENDHWRVLGLDTGYNSVGLPILGMTHLFRSPCELEAALLDWLREIVQAGDKPKPTVLLSHHQYFSAFDDDYPRPAQQLEEFIDAPVLWLWGHEHRFSGYRLGGPGALQVHGRCIGHGGMPIEAKDPAPDAEHLHRLWFYDRRVNPHYLADHLGYNGFAQLYFNGTELKISYYSLELEGPDQKNYAQKPLLMLTETFATKGNGVISRGMELGPRAPEGLVVR